MLCPRVAKSEGINDPSKNVHGYFVQEHFFAAYLELQRNGSFLDEVSCLHGIQPGSGLLPAFLSFDYS